MVKTHKNTALFSMTIFMIIWLYACKEEPILPIVSTTPVTFITSTSISTGGYILNDGGALISDRGVCWGKSENPTTAENLVHDSTGLLVFSNVIKGLSLNTTYYFRAFAINITGIGYGDQKSITTDPTIVSDIDGNAYKVIRIGSQIWMAENLKVTHYRNSNLIPNVMNNDSWGNLTTGARCYHNNDSLTYCKTYGALYNWYAVNTNNLCPSGWHVPSKDELFTLVNYLGNVAGGKLKESGTSHWNSPNEGATNETGFTALPGGDRYYTDKPGVFGDIGSNGFWWSTTLFYDTPWYLYLNYGLFGTMITTADKTYGYSIRCLRD